MIVLDVKYCDECPEHRPKKSLTTYKQRLKAMYIRSGAGGKKWLKVGYFCPKCHKMFDLSYE